ncbi:MAG: hypothetical protein J7647_18660 [Cyanobacteria bacterium SBLK]|nr:hypothetical protein [Cyanobacteria bacterium SBLK]
MANASDGNRLDRIEENLAWLTTVVSNLAQSHQQLQTTVSNLAQKNQELNSTVTSLVQIVEIHQANHETSQRNFEIVVGRLEAIETEIRGLRTESLRIIEHLFGEQQE